MSDKVDEIYNMLLLYGITEKIKIDDKDVEVVFSALTAPGIEVVYIDNEGGLVIEYKDLEHEQGTV